MKTKHKNLLNFFSLIIFIFSASTALAQPPGPPMKDPEAMNQRKELHLKRMMEQLNLSEKQQELLEAHKENHRAEAEELRTNLWAKKEALREALEEQELNMTHINQLHSEIKDLHAQKADHRLAGVLEVREILTPDQFCVIHGTEGQTQEPARDEAWASSLFGGVRTGPHDVHSSVEFYRQPPGYLFLMPGCCLVNHREKQTAVKEEII